MKSRSVSPSRRPTQLTASSPALPNVRRRPKARRASSSSEHVQAMAAHRRTMPARAMSARDPSREDDDDDPGMSMSASAHEHSPFRTRSSYQTADFEDASDPSLDDALEARGGPAATGAVAAFLASFRNTASSLSADIGAEAQHDQDDAAKDKGGESQSKAIDNDKAEGDKDENEDDFDLGPRWQREQFAKEHEVGNTPAPSNNKASDDARCGNIFDQRQDLRHVDQSVNLMDPSTAPKSPRASLSRYLGRNELLDDVYLENSQRTNPTRRWGEATVGGRWKWQCNNKTVVTCVLVVMIMVPVVLVPLLVPIPGIPSALLEWQQHMMASSSPQEPTTDETQLERTKAVQSVLEDAGITDASEWKDPASPASQALQWISEKDPLRVPLPQDMRRNLRQQSLNEIINRNEYYDKHHQSQPQPNFFSRYLRHHSGQRRLEGTALHRNLQLGLFGDPNEEPSKLDKDIIDRLVQRYALAVFYYSMLPTMEQDHGQSTRTKGSVADKIARQESPGSNGLGDTWLTADHECTWLGITCDILPDDPMAKNKTTVLTLNVSSMDLSGTLPPELGALTHLLIFDVSHNHLRSTIPASYGNLYRTMQHFHVTDNRISGTLPEFFHQFSHLRVLNLDHNKFEGKLNNEWFGQYYKNRGLIRLQELWVNDNLLSGALPQRLAEKLPKLNTLMLYNNELKGRVQPEIGKLKDLERLYIYGNELTGRIPDQLCQLGAEIYADCNNRVGCNCCKKCY